MTEMPEHPLLLPDATAAPHALSRPLPPYRGIVAVDAKDFTGYPAIEHGVISRAIPQLLQTSFQQAGLAELWQNRRFPNSTGDGYVFGFDPAAMPFVIHPWLRLLQDVLTEFNVHSMGAVRIRLRVSLHIGPLPDSGLEYDGNGTPRNDTHRLLDPPGQGHSGRLQREHHPGGGHHLRPLPPGRSGQRLHRAAPRPLHRGARDG